MPLFSEPRTRDNVRRSVVLCAFILTGAFVYFPALRGTWLWDDAAEVAQNPLLRDRSGLLKIWKGAEGDDYFPIKSTLQWIEWHLWGGHVEGYHVANLFLHLLSAVLIWRLLNRLGMRRGWIGGLVWIAHPMAVESVAWIAEFKNTLCMPPLLMAFTDYIDYRRSAAKAPYVRSVLWFAAASLCKASVVMFPVTLLLHDALFPEAADPAESKRPDHPPWLKRLTVLAPFFTVSVVIGSLAVRLQNHRVIAHQIMPQTNFGERIAGAWHATAFYLGHCLFPQPPFPIYPPRTGWGRSTVEDAVAWLAIAGCAAWAWRLRRGPGRYFLLGAGFFILNLVPVLGVVPLAYFRIAPVSDHFAYLSLAAAAGLFAACAEAGLAAAPRRLAPCLALAGLGFLGAFAAEARRYASVFRSDEALWNYALAKNPSAWLAHNNLILDDLAEGAVGEAIRQGREAEALRPDLPEIHANLGSAELEAGRTAEAAAEFREAIRLGPGLASVHLNLGRALLASGELKEAGDEFDAALRQDGESGPLDNFIGMLRARGNRWPEALASFGRALEFDPENAEFHVNFGSALSHLGRWTEAISHYERALAIRPQFPEAENNLANALANTGRFSAAVSHYEAALRMNPGNAGTRRNLSLALHALGREEEAHLQSEEAARLEAVR